MQHISWTNIDWIPVQWTLMGILVSIIIVLRIIRRITRWSPVNGSNVECKKIEINQSESFLFSPKDEILDDDSSNKKWEEGKKILIVPPLSIKNIRGYNLAVALVQLNHPVIVYPNENLQQLLIDEKDSGMKLAEILNNFNITNVILFDWAINPILNQIMSSDVQKSILYPNIHWTLIRPIDYSSLFHIFKLVPFTNRWFYLLKLKKVAKKLELSNFVNLFGNNMKFSIYNPEKTLSNTNFIMGDEIKKRNGIEIVSFSSGGWSFYRQETVLFGNIIKNIQ